jgi:hypothetical protein
MISYKPYKSCEICGKFDHVDYCLYPYELTMTNKNYGVGYVMIVMNKELWIYIKELYMKDAIGNEIVNDKLYSVCHVRNGFIFVDIGTVYSTSSESTGTSKKNSVRFEKFRMGVGIGDSEIKYNNLIEYTVVTVFANCLIPFAGNLNDINWERF